MPFNYSIQSAQEQALEMLNQYHLMNGVFYDELCALVKLSIHPITTASLLNIMGANHLLDSENLIQIKETLDDVREVRDILHYIETINLLDIEEGKHNFTKIMDFPSKKNLCNLISSLKNISQQASNPSEMILSQALFDVIINPSYSHNLPHCTSIITDARFHILFDITLSHDYIQIILEHNNPLEMFDALLVLKQEGLLNCLDGDFYIEDIKNSVAPKTLSQAFAKLRNNGLLFGNNGYQMRHFVVEARSPLKVADAIIEFKRVGILASNAYYQCLKDLIPLSSQQIAVRVRLLTRMYVSLPDIFDVIHDSYVAKILNHTTPDEAMEAMILLSSNRLLSGQFGRYNASSIFSCSSPRVMANILVGLYNHSLLSGYAAEKHRKLLLGQNQIINLCTLLEIFLDNMPYVGNERDVLAAKTKNFRFLARHPNLRAILHFTQSFTPDLYHDLFEFIKKYPDLVNETLVSSLFWARFFSRRLNRNNFQHIVRLCEERQDDLNLARTAISHYIAAEELRRNIVSHPTMGVQTTNPSSNGVKRRSDALFQYERISTNQERLDALASTPGLVQAGYIAAEPNESWICPITLQLMDQPVSSGSSYLGYYEHHALMQWVTTNQTDPYTREIVTLNMIQNQPQIQQEIEKFLSDQEAIKNNFEKSAGASVSQAADSSPFRMS